MESESIETLEMQVSSLQKELEEVREQKGRFELELGQFQTLCEVSRRNLQQVKAKLSSSQRERDEKNECHWVEINHYKQKLKHLQSEQHNAILELKVRGVVLTSVVQNQLINAELMHRRQNDGLLEDLRERLLHSKDNIKELKLRYQEEIMELINSYETKIRFVEEKFQNKLQEVIMADDKIWKADHTRIQNKVKSCIEALRQEHNKTITNALDSLAHRQIIAADEHVRLTRELGEATEQLVFADKRLLAAQEKNVSLHGLLQEAEKRLGELHKEQEEEFQVKKERLSLTAQQTKEKSDREVRDMTVRYELLLRDCEKAQQERDKLAKRQTAAILAVRQRHGQDQLLMMKQLELLSENVEWKKFEHSAILSALDLAIVN